MKVLGISGSPRKGQTTDQLVKEVLAGIGLETEFVSLAGKRIGPCIACLGCVKDNICKVEDDMQALREKIVEADAYVIGAANYFSTLNGLGHCFLERFYQFRRQEGKAVAGKLGIAVGVGGSSGDPVVANIKTFFQYNQIECIGTVSAQGPACCFICGYGEPAKLGPFTCSSGRAQKSRRRSHPAFPNRMQKLKKPDLSAACLNSGCVVLLPSHSRSAKFVGSLRRCICNHSSAGLERPA